MSGCQRRQNEWVPCKAMMDSTSSPYRAELMEPYVGPFVSDEIDHLALVPGLRRPLCPSTDPTWPPFRSLAGQSDDYFGSQAVVHKREGVIMYRRKGWMIVAAFVLVGLGGWLLLALNSE